MDEKELDSKFTEEHVCENTVNDTASEVVVTEAFKNQGSSNSNTYVDNNQKYCQKCGTPVGASLFCSNCGAPVSATQIEPKAQNSKNKAVVVIGIILIVLILALISYLTVTNFFIPKSHYDAGISSMENGDYDNALSEFVAAGNYKDSVQKIDDVKKLQEQKAEEEKQKAEADALAARLYKFNVAYSHCSSSRTTLSSDGKSIYVDSKDEYDYVSMLDIFQIVEDLDLPDSLVSEMESTNSLMGRLTETYGDIQVSWSYHPKNGLDVVFSLID